eukprot:gnl/TRDRNA2_/TRDRNA2_176490_c11_seq32.p1 gnl/TRDRNA2_/TRDRNA2_176490_c11~~gnl/TRDRNA2_/TRDRNA2_176490_c11_seq32.p1  ORF type:complete len:477 (-),score=81.02 gnl/TRDRNA2_/TRDRNA2_176490_c11_seq32:447-1685(-)
MYLAGVVSVAMFNRSPLAGKLDAPQQVQVYEEKMRVKFHSVLSAAKAAGATALVVPDVGCGIQGNDPRVVGRLFGEVLRRDFWTHLQEVWLVGRLEFQEAVMDAIENKPKLKRIYSIKAPPHLAKKTLGEIDFKGNFDILPLAIRKGTATNYNIGPELTLDHGSVLSFAFLRSSNDMNILMKMVEPNEPATKKERKEQKKRAKDRMRSIAIKPKDHKVYFHEVDPDWVDKPISSLNLRQFGINLWGIHRRNDAESQRTGYNEWFPGSDDSFRAGDLMILGDVDNALFQEWERQQRVKREAEEQARYQDEQDTEAEAMQTPQVHMAQPVQPPQPRILYPDYGPPGVNLSRDYPEYEEKRNRSSPQGSPRETMQTVRDLSMEVSRGDARVVVPYVPVKVTEVASEERIYCFPST